MTSTSNLVFLYILVSVMSLVSTVTHVYHDYIVIGAGPSGLQMGYFLKRAGRDYVILERANTSGNFYTTYPRHDKLISINKRHTGKSNKEFNFRHDWNSLISDNENLQMTRYSKEFFPPRETIVDYLNDYQRVLGINVQHNTNVQDVRRFFNESITDWQFSMADQRGNSYLCKTLIMATGMWKPNTPSFNGSEYVEGYEDVSVNPDDFEGQTVLILGRGNAAFEVADRIMGSTNLIHMVGRSRVRLSWATHYVGDLRAVNNGLLDTYQLKSLDGVLEAPVEEITLVKRDDGKLHMELFSDGESEEEMFDNFALRESYDRVIRCLGFTFDTSIFNNDTVISRGKGRREKYPRIKYDYQMKDVPGLYVIGTASHSLDHRKSAGGFIHGFRYTARSVHNLLEAKNHNVQWPSHSGPVSNLVSAILKRINEASGIYQMFGMLGDVIAFRNNHEEYEYFEEFPINLVHQFPQFASTDVEDVIVVNLEYGANFSGPGNDIFRLDRATGEPSEAHRSNFLHPVFYYYKKLPSAHDMTHKAKWEQLPRPDLMHHIVEDFLTTWDAPTSHILPLRRYIENILNQDMRYFFVEDCFKLALTHQTLPHMCEEQFLQGEGIVATEDLLTQALKSGLLVS